jgi:cytoskeletal protein CcmA (bactofilin family)
VLCIRARVWVNSSRVECSFRAREMLVEGGVVVSCVRVVPRAKAMEKGRLDGEVLASVVEGSVGREMEDM